MIAIRDDRLAVPEGDGSMGTKNQELADYFIDAAEGKRSGAVAGSDRRIKKRVPYNALVAIVLVGPTGQRGQPIVLRAKDLSLGGLCVLSRTMMYPGSRGAVQLVRSTGDVALVGVEVRHCRYSGDMQHQVGLQFVPMAAELASDSFLAQTGRMALLDPSLKADAA